MPWLGSSVQLRLASFFQPHITIHPSLALSQFTRRCLRELGRRDRGSNAAKSASEADFPQQLGLTSRPLFDPDDVYFFDLSPLTQRQQGKHRPQIQHRHSLFFAIQFILQTHQPATQAKLRYHRKDRLPCTCMLPHD